MIDRNLFIDDCNNVIEMYFLFKFENNSQRIINDIRHLRDNIDDNSEVILSKYKDTFNNLYALKHFKVKDVFNISLLDVDKIFIYHRDQLNDLYNKGLNIIDELKYNKHVDHQSNKNKLEEIKKDISVYKGIYDNFVKETPLSNQIKENQRRFNFINSLMENIEKNKELVLIIYHSGDIYY